MGTGFEECGDDLGVDGVASGGAEEGCGAVAVLGGQDLAQHQLRFEVVGRRLEGLAEVVEGLGQVATGRPGHRQRATHLGVVGLEVPRPLEPVNRLVQVAGGDGLLALGHGVGGLGRHRADLAGIDGLAHGRRELVQGRQGLGRQRQGGRRARRRNRGRLDALAWSDFSLLAPRDAGQQQPRGHEGNDPQP